MRASGAVSRPATPRPRPPRPGRAASLLLACAAVLLATVPARAGPKTDVIVLLNGDRITGDIKSMTRGRLEYSTDDVGRLQVEWSKIASIRTTHLLQVDLASGEKLFGVLAPGSAPGMVLVGTDPGVEVPIGDVVAMVLVDAGFLQRIRAYLDVGASFAKANSALTLTGDGEVAYRGRTLGGTLAAEGYYQKTADGNGVGRYAIRPSGLYDFGVWRAILFAGIEHNDELDLSLRFSLGAGAAYPVVRNGWTELWLTAGLNWDRERYTGGDPRDNLTGYLAASWEAFRFDSPTLDLEIQVLVLPSLTEPGRVRGDTTIRVKYELFSDFKVGLGLSHQFDNRPPLDAPHTDYVLSLTIGWSYRR